ncbi:AzlD domain-containing protein [Andreprevotia chitinilytica]|uniref:AzlD domain-containing protein n=1 Tax=Andreprevotia chitinilytica TaxID=396808 RepID=UPI000550BC42|nr:AzlD domain-containing protein [Andreprevotia chitinilytica]
MIQAPLDTILMLAGMAVVTYSVRIGFWLGASHGFPPRLRRALEYVPVAVLSAIIFPTVLLPGGVLSVSIHNAQLAGALATGLIVWRFKHLLAGIGGGLVVFVVWRLVM